jgi:hypothetical protein
MQSKSKEGKSCFLSENAAQDAISCPLLFLSPSFFKGEEGYGQVAGCLLDGECDIFHPQ